MDKQTVSPLDHLVKRSESKPPQSESQIEQDILDLFHKVLGWSKTAACRQDSKVDIVLRPDLSTKIVIEIKKLSDFKSMTHRSEAIRQGSRYLLVYQPPQCFGIATDGITWSFFKVSKFGGYHRAHRLLEFRADKHKKLALVVCKRLVSGSIKRFFQTLAAVHEDMTDQEFDLLMNSSLEERLEKLTFKAQTKGVKVVEGDLRVLREFYTGGQLPVHLFEAMSVRKPVKITKKT